MVLDRILGLTQLAVMVIVLIGLLVMGLIVVDYYTERKEEMQIRLVLNDVLEDSYELYDKDSKKGLYQYKSNKKIYTVKYRKKSKEVDTITHNDNIIWERE